MHESLSSYRLIHIMIFVIIFFAIAFVLEIAVWVLVAQFISGWYVFFWFIIAAMIGIKMMTSSMKILKPSLQNIYTMGSNFEGELGKRLAWAVSGLLFAIPGLISDFFALLILLPATQKILRQSAMSVVAKRQQKMMNDMFGQMGNMNMGGGAGNPFAEMMQEMQRQQQRGGGSIIDVEAQDVTPKSQRIEHKK